tara:strand:+ start:7167 stop:8795 length:1629 start_codon:yes stop_codon:yes gene_type:complete
MYNNWYYPNFPCYQGTNYFPNGSPNYNNFKDQSKVSVSPININLNINNSKDLTIKQPSQTYNTNSGQVIVPEINISIHFDKTYKNESNYESKFESKNDSKYEYGGPLPQHKKFRKNPRKRRDNYRKSNDRKHKYYDKSKHSPLIPPGARMIKVDLNSLKKGDNPLEDLFKKLFGLDLNKKEDRKLEAPLSKELNFNLEKEYEELPFEVKDLTGLISLADLYDKENQHMYGFNMKRLSIIRNSLISLNEIIGMEQVKTNIANKIITYLQGLGDLDNMNHVVIQAPPGYGKTMLAFHLSEIFYKLGLIKQFTDDKTDKKVYEHPFTGEKIDFPFIVAKRKDLIGEYVGHTAPKVEKAVEDALGGVLFIDEAYSLGSTGKDSYSDEAINTLNQLLSEKAGQFICIIAGYKDQLKKSFFTNPGLQRRFRTVFEIKKYTDNELALIFQKMVLKKGWKLNNKIIENNLETLSKFINKNRNMFKYCGGDMDTYLQSVRDAHSLRVFGLHPKIKKTITVKDLETGFKLYEKSTDRNNDIISDSILNSLYC